MKIVRAYVFKQKNIITTSLKRFENDIFCGKILAQSRHNSIMIFFIKYSKTFPIE
jgi:hypothetical protein